MGADASFEILGMPYSLLSVSLAPSQDLYTRRGTLVGLAGPPDNVVSTLRILSPLRRGLVGIPFLYQKVTSTAPISALIATRSPLTSFAILQLDGTTDWKLAQRKALLAWTGRTISVRPSVYNKLSIAHWGSSDVTGRGLLALAGQGQVYTIELARGETYVAHPSNVLAYSLPASSSPTSPSTSILPQPYRFKSSQATLSIPLALGNFFPTSKFVENLKNSDTWRFVSRVAWRVRTWSRRNIWGDRLFLRFTGPTTLLVQTRGPRVRDVLSRAEVNEIADAPAGTVPDAVEAATRTGIEGAVPSATPNPVAANAAAAAAAAASGTLSGGASVGARGVTPANSGLTSPSSSPPPNPSPSPGSTPDLGPVVTVTSPQQPQPPRPKLSVASISADGKVTFTATQNFDQLQKPS